MKSARHFLPLVVLAAAVTFCTGEGEADKFRISDDQAAKIAGALPSKTPVPVKKKHEVLVFTKTAGFRHSSIPVGVACMKALGEKTGLFAVTHTEDETMFRSDSLAKFDAVIFLNSTGPVFKGSPEGEEALQKSLTDFVRGGKGIVGFHSAGDTYNDWQGWAEMMGTGFESHPWGAGDTVRVKNLDPKHPLTAAFGGEGFTLKDEIYKFKPGRALPSERRMLLALDTESPETNMKKDMKDGKPARDFYPIAWLSKYGEGRTFYCSLGHNEHVYWTPQVVAHYLAGIQYALGELPADATPKTVAMVMSDGRVIAQR